MKHITIFCLFISLIIGCKTTHLHRLKNHPNFSERSVITSDSVKTLVQDVLYNRPGVIDEEYSYMLRYKLIDTTAAKEKRILDLSKDTSIVKTQYFLASVWNWSEPNNLVSGTIEVVHWETNKIILKQNVYVEDYVEKEQVKFIGIRTFETREGW